MRVFQWIFPFLRYYRQRREPGWGAAGLMFLIIGILVAMGVLICEFRYVLAFDSWTSFSQSVHWIVESVLKDVVSASSSSHVLLVWCLSMVYLLPIVALFAGQSAVYRTRGDSFLSSIGVGVKYALLIMPGLFVVFVIILVVFRGPLGDRVPDGLRSACVTILWLSYVCWSTIVSSVAIRRLYTAGFCRQCGYDLTGLTEPRCPECGKPFDPKLLSEPSPNGTAKDEPGEGSV